MHSPKPRTTTQHFFPDIDIKAKTWSKREEPHAETDGNNLSNEPEYHDLDNTASKEPKDSRDNNIHTLSKLPEGKEDPADELGFKHVHVRHSSPRMKRDLPRLECTTFPHNRSDSEHQGLLSASKRIVIIPLIPSQTV